ncbi:MAG: hypothetical protein J6C05_09295 [Prevotella sp.]|nr:hypothetical protein [Prevotella sp.]
MQNSFFISTKHYSLFIPALVANPSCVRFNSSLRVFTLAAICNAVSLGLKTLNAIILFICKLFANKKIKYYLLQSYKKVNNLMFFMAVTSAIPASDRNRTPFPIRFHRYNTSKIIFLSQKVNDLSQEINDLSLPFQLFCLTLHAHLRFQPQCALIAGLTGLRAKGQKRESNAECGKQNF